MTLTCLTHRPLDALPPDTLHRHGGAGWRRLEDPDRVLIDAGDIVVHLFKPEARAMYALEKMWGADLDEVPSPA